MNKKRLLAFLLCFLILMTSSLLYASAEENKKEKKIEQYTSIDQLNNENVHLGVITGMVREDFYKQITPKAKLDYFNNLTDLLVALKNGQIDGYLDDTPLVRYVVAHNEGITAIEKELGNYLDTAFVYGDTEFDRNIQKDLDPFIRKLKEEGTIDEMFELWCGTDEEKQVLSYATEGKNGTIKVCCYAESAPTAYVQNGQIVGIELDILNRFCKEYGYGLSVEAMDFGALFNGVKSGRFNIASGYISVTEERKESITFSEPFLTSSELMVVRKPVEKKDFWIALKESFNKTFIREDRWKMIAKGIETTLIISILSAILGTLLGFGICLIRRMKNPIIHGITTIYIRVLQGTPVLVLLMILFYIVFAKTGLSSIMVATIAFALNFSAYVCEMFRTGIDGVDIGQTEAAYALGYTKIQTFFRIVLPQAAQTFLPVYKGEFISLVKMTSVVGYIAVQDLTKMSDLIRSRTYDAFFPLIASAIIYFLLATLLTSLLTAIEFKIEPNRKVRIVKGVKAE